MRGKEEGERERERERVRVHAYNDCMGKHELHKLINHKLITQITNYGC